MGGVAKAVGGVASKGKGGDNPGASENTIKNAMIYPELRDPSYRAIQDATRLYQQGYSVPEMNRRQWQGIEGIEDFAQNYSGQLGDVMGNVTNIARGNRQGDAPGQEFLQDVYQGGAPKEGWDTLRGAIDLADDQSGGLDWLRETARGQMVGQNPYVDNVIKSMNRGTTDAYGNAVAGMEGQMSRAGGMGGSMEALLRGKQNEGLATSLAENEAKIRYADYGQERGYQEAARQALPGAHATEVGTMLNAGNAMNNAANQRLQMQMEAANQAGQGYRSDIQQQLGAAGLMPGLGTSGFLPGQQLLSAGEYTRSNLQNQNNAGWTGLQQYLDSLRGVRNLFSNQGTIEQAPDAGAQMVGNLTQLGTMGAQAYMMSDRRLKTDVEEVGHGLYRWRYLGGSRRYEGPLAQDVLAVAPELVAEVGGYLMIPASLIREVV
jgi:hypothetical protein